MCKVDLKKIILDNYNAPNNYPIPQLLLVFEDGQERYNNEMLLNKCINAIHRGANPIVLLDQVLKIQAETQNQLTEHIKLYGTSPILMPKYGLE